jgi:hypothetical protein
MDWIPLFFSEIGDIAVLCFGFRDIMDTLCRKVITCENPWKYCRFQQLIGDRRRKNICNRLSEGRNFE